MIANIMHVIINLELEMFDQVHNRGGRASCQENPTLFRMMRQCQFESWNVLTIESYRSDIEFAKMVGRNLVAEKYAYMMESTAPKEFEQIKKNLPCISDEAFDIIKEIVLVQVAWEREVDQCYPLVRSGGRPLTSDLDSPWVTSFETYLRGELKTYSIRTLRHYIGYIRQCLCKNHNLAHVVTEKIVKVYGYFSLEDAEKRLLNDLHYGI